MDLWQVRNQALASLSDDLKQENEILERCFSLFDKCMELFYSQSIKEDEHEFFTAICFQLLVKARRLALGSYSLYLDGFELEAGALMRPLLESWQLLTYFQQEPSRIEEVFAGRLPKAGDVARAISKEINIYDGVHDLRRHYNEFSSHLSLKEKALVPGKVTYDEEALKSNMYLLFYLMGSIVYDAILCLCVTGLSGIDLLDEIDSVKENGFRIFEIAGNL